MSINRMTALRGIIPAMISPLLARDQLDAAGLENLVEHVLAGGVHGLFILGTTGEGPHLSYELRRQLVAMTVRLVNGRVPVLVGITDTSYAESIALARFSADEGADAVVMSVPYYFQISQDELFNHVQQFTHDAPLPLLLYNIPQMTKVEFAVETIRRVLDLPNVIGIKDSSHDWAYFRRLKETLADHPKTSLFMGCEDLLADALRLGAHGGVSGGANVFPRLFVALFEALQRGDEMSASDLHQDVMQIHHLLYSVGLGDAAALKSIKCALSYLGICQDFVAPPLQPFPAAKRNIVHERFEQIMSRRYDEARSVPRPHLDSDGLGTPKKVVVGKATDSANGAIVDGHIRYYNQPS